MIERDVRVTVQENSSMLDSEIILYRGDGNITFNFAIEDKRYRYKAPTNIAKSMNAQLGNAVIKKQDGEILYSDFYEITEDFILPITITKEMIDELTEVGTIMIQIHLYDGDSNRLTIPHFIITVKSRMIDEWGSQL